MTSSIYEIPKRVVKLLRTVGPIHETVRDDYCYAVRLVLGEDDATAGFIVEQRMAERAASAAEGSGFAFQVPVKADSQTEATFIFVGTLTEALNIIERTRET